jgi:MFS family permease
VGVVAGFGELIGYGFRLLSGLISDRTGRYWAVAIAGYVINLTFVPLLAVTRIWPTAALCVIAERFGKAIRNPARDAMLSYAAQEVGRGRGFGIHHGLDQIGAVLGPLFVALVLLSGGIYTQCFGLLAIPAVMAISVLLGTRYLYPHPRHLETGSQVPEEGATYPKEFWYYVAAVSCVAFGFVDYALIAFHFEKSGAVSMVWIPVLYAVAMLASAMSSYGVGRIFDHYGTRVMVWVTVLCAAFVPMVFLGGLLTSVVGMLLWGIGIGSQTTVMAAMIGHVISPNKRATAYGVLNVFFGVSWFFGSALMGFLYDISLGALVSCSIVAQLLALPLFMKASIAVSPPSR